MKRLADICARWLTAGSVGAILMTVVTPAGATACMVMGERSSRVVSAEGEKSPPFMTNDCQTLRLLTGKAMVSWVARDGKPNFADIGVQGPARLPVPGSEERSGKVVWSELTSKREATRPAFMRSLDEERPAKVYLPEEGLSLAPVPGATLKVLRESNEKQTLVHEATGKGPHKIGRENLELGVRYTIEWTNGDQVQKMRWVLLDEQETRKLDAQRAEIFSSDLDASQKKMLEAMLYEQLRLKTNMDLSIQAQRQ